MSARKATYVDSSAIVKLASHEPESAAVRRYLRSRRPLVTSALARTEVNRALLPFGPLAVTRGIDVLRRFDVIRISEKILRDAGSLLPPELRSLDAIHLASAAALGADLARLCTYDDRMSQAAEGLGMNVVAPR